MPEDFLRRFMFEDLSVKGSLVRISSCWQEVLLRARPEPASKNVLGEALCASALLTSNIKFSGSVSLQIQSEGLLRLVLGQCSHDGKIRGVARQREDKALPLLQQAILSINLEPENGSVPYQGVVELGEGGLVPAMEHYFSHSEQLESRFWLVAGDSQCSGFMLQKMPVASEDPDGWNRVQQLAATLSENELQLLAPQQLIRTLFHQENVRLFSAIDLEFSCSCSLQKVTGMLNSLGQEELLGLIEERGLVEVTCEYCGKDYRFDPIDIARILSDSSSPVAQSAGIH